MKLNRILLIALIAFVANVADIAQAQNQKREKKNSKKGEETEIAEVKKPVPPANSAPAALGTILGDGAKKSEGLFNVVEKDGQFYFMLTEKDFERDFLMVTRISKAPADLRAGFTGYAGDIVSEEMFRFKRVDQQKKVFIETVSTREMPRDTTGGMYYNVMRSNMQPLSAAFEVKAQNGAKDTLMIDVTEFLEGDNDMVSITGRVKSSLKLNNLEKDRSYIQGIKTFPINTEIRAVKTYNYVPESRFPGASAQSPQPATFEINTSIIALPEDLMQPRYADNRVGYFTENFVDFDKNPQGVKNVAMITRWRLEPKPEDEEAYRRGELVEPAEPIIYYIDPTTPKEWVPYLIQGVNDWEPAFREAGFKNAIMALEAPVGDSTWSLEDARHSAIVYKPSTIPNASGPNVHDPRTGQILESHINWYHNVMSLLRNWYMIQVGPNNPEGQKMEFSTELMGELVRFVSSHEVGHTLGLRHNFGSTAMVPVDSLRSATFLARYGHAPSIMDYSRFNYVVQPEDNISPKLQYPRINDYDVWAIEWGYRRFLDLKTPESEADKLNQWIIEKNENPRLWFGTETNPNDPRSQSEDLGDNQMEANALGIKNLQRVLAGLPQWTATKNEGFDNLKTMYSEVISQYGRYVGHVAKWIGGIYENPKTIEQGSDVYSYVEKAKQQEAMTWLNTHLFTTPSWLFDAQIMASTGATPMSIANNIYGTAMGKVVSTRVMDNLVSAEAALGNNAYTISNYFADLNRYIMTSNPDAIKRMLQKIYVTRLLAYAEEGQMRGSLSTVNDTQAMILAELRKIEASLKSSQSSNAVILAHNKYLVEQIQKALDTK